LPARRRSSRCWRWSAASTFSPASIWPNWIARVEDRCGGHGLALATPRDPARRGSQVSFAHPHAYEIMQALIARGVIGDFRAPDILRCGFTPLYLRYEDVWRAVEVLAEVMEAGAWRDPRFAVRSRVT
jgi:kynureninase